MSKFKGKLGTLPIGLQQSLALWLLEGRTYDECREQLRDAGARADCIPSGTKGFIAFRKSAFFAAFSRQFTDASSKAERKGALVKALEGQGGITSLADAIMVETLFKVSDELAQGDIPAAKIAFSIAALKRAALADAEATNKRKVVELQARLKALASTGAAVDPARVAAELDDLLGVKA